MRKVISLGLALCVLLSLAVSAYAQESSENYTQGIPVEPSKIANVPCTRIISLDEHLRATSDRRNFESTFDFAGVNPDILIPDYVGFQVPDRGAVNVIITSCSWSPIYYDIEVGLWNMTNGNYYYGTMLYGGSQTGSFSLSNLPGGTYRVCVWNRGDTALDRGWISFHL